MTDFPLTPAQAGITDEKGLDVIRTLTEGSILAKAPDADQLWAVTPDGQLVEFDGPEHEEEEPPPPVPDEVIEGDAEEIPVGTEELDSDNPDDFKPPEAVLAVDTREIDVGHEISRAMDRNDEVLILDELAGRTLSTMLYAFGEGNDRKVDLSYAGVNEVVRLMNERGGCAIGISEQQPIVDEVREGEKDYYRVLTFARDARRPEAGRWGVAIEPKQMKLRNGNEVWDKFALSKCLSKSQRNALKTQIPEEWRQQLIAMHEGGDRLKVLKPVGGGNVAELPPVLDDEEAQQIKKEIHDVYNRLKEFNRLKVPPARFNLFLTKAETESHDRMRAFRDQLQEYLEAEEEGAKS